MSLELILIPLALAGAAKHVCKNHFQIWILLKNLIHLVYNTSYMSKIRLFIISYWKAFSLIITGTNIGFPDLILGAFPILVRYALLSIKFDM
jgi:hypothetical protein